MSKLLIMFVAVFISIGAVGDEASVCNLEVTDSVTRYVEGYPAISHSEICRIATNLAKSELGLNISPNKWWRLEADYKTRRLLVLYGGGKGLEVYITMNSDGSNPLVHHHSWSNM